MTTLEFVLSAAVPVVLVLGFAWGYARGFRAGARRSLSHVRALALRALPALAMAGYFIAPAIIEKFRKKDTKSL